MPLPLQFDIYKGMKGTNGAVQFSLQHPYKFCTSCKKKDYTRSMDMCCGAKPTDKEGTIFVDITSAIGDNVYDWKNKIKVALSVTDVGIILNGMQNASVGSTIKLMHDPNAQTPTMGKIKKFITLSTPNGPQDSWIMQVTESNSGENRTHKVPISAAEATILMALFRTAIPAMLGW